MAVPPGLRSDEAVRREAIDWLARLRGGSGDPVAFENWYSADPRHAAIYDSVLANWEAMAALAGAPPGKAGRPKGIVTRRRFALAATVALLLGGLAFALLRAGGTGGPARPEPAQMASRVGEIRRFVLADGSRVVLDTGSQVAIAYSESERRLFLRRGRARFDVAHEADRPFIVVAGGVEVIAHGTIFDIDLQAARPAVSLLRGAIEVRNAAHPEQRRLLRPGQKSLIALRAAPQPPVALPQAERDWPSGMLSFTDAPLADIAAAANRYAPQRLIIADPAIAALRFTGTFRANDMTALAALLADSFGLEVARDDRGNFLLGSPGRKK